MRRPPLGLLVAVVALAAGTAVTAAATPPGKGVHAASSVEVVGAAAVCPDLRYQVGTLSTRVSVGSAPLPPGRRAGNGTASYRFLVKGGPATLPLPVTAPGQVVTGLGAFKDGEAFQTLATGALAVGLEVEQITRGESSTSSTRGLAGVRCVPPQREGWFVGGATGVHDTTALVLVNAEDTPATVDTQVFTPHGLADPRLGQGITVAPHGRAVISLDTLAPDQTLLAVHVVARRGRVAMAMRQQRFSPAAPMGTEYVPLTAPPAMHVTVPGFPQGANPRSLFLANPGSDDTTVSLRVTTGDGQFVPVGYDHVPVPAGQTVAVSLTGFAKTSPLSVDVTSDVSPVIASGQVLDSQGTSVQDFAYTAGTGPLAGDALLTDLVIDRPTESTLILTAPDTAATVVVRPIRVVGTPGALPAPRTLTVPAGRTIAFRLSTFFPPGTATRLAVMVQPQPGSGPLYAARYLRARGAHGPLTTLLTLQGPAQRVTRPAVVPDDGASYG